jgi:hypothetical protein
MASSGKNKPCPCGSGETYENCCLIEDALSAARMDEKSFSQAVMSMMEKRKFSSLEEAQSELDRLTRAKNISPLDDFCGLSPEQMYRLLYYPFDTPRLVDFNLELTRFPDSPFFRLLSFLVKGVAREDLKATALGNLPPVFVREAAQWYYGEQDYQQRRKYISYRTETDFSVFNTVRVVAEMAGLVRKYKKRFHLTKDGKVVAENGMDGKSFIKIFKTYTRKFNWAYNDRCPDLHIVQESFLFMFYILTKYGGTFRPVSFYEDLFLTAFPNEIRDLPDDSFDTREDILKRCFSLRAISRFGHFLGFIEINDPENARWIEKLSVKKTAFLDDWVRFSIS